MNVVDEIATGFAAPRGQPRIQRAWSAAAVLWIAFIANGGVIVWLWLHGGGVSAVHSGSDLETSLGRITGLLGVYSALIQILLLSRLPALERLVGFDALSVWHRRNGKLCIYMVVAHTVLITFGYAGYDKIGFGPEFTRFLGEYPGMVTALAGTALMVAIFFSSLVIVRRRLPYEAWYALHFAMYGAIALTYLHQIPTGNEFLDNPAQADYWIGLYCATLLALLLFRVALPVRDAWRHRLRVESVDLEGPDVISVWIRGRRLEELGALGGQFMLWRFLTRGRWWQSHPFSLSALPHAGALRLTIKQVGGFTHGLADLRPGTRVLAEGPFGRFTVAVRRRRRVALIAGGIGITPIRALLEELADGEPILVYRALREKDLVLLGELEQLAAERGGAVRCVVGDHRDPAASSLMSPAHLAELVDDIVEREVYLCGPGAMMQSVKRSLRQLGVPRRHIHMERFALAL